MDWLKFINSFYPKYWNIAQVWDAVQCVKITQEQFTEITYEPYPTERPVV